MEDKLETAALQRTGAFSSLGCSSTKDTKDKKMCTQNYSIHCKTSLLCVYILWIVYCASSEVISTEVGLTAVLPCVINNTQIQRPRVCWRTDSEIVIERWNGMSYVAKGYEGHVDISEEALLKGNCSLVLKNVRKSNAGIYQSYMLVRNEKPPFSHEWRLIGSVEFSVHGYAEKTSPCLLLMGVSLFFHA